MKEKLLKVLRTVAVVLGVLVILVLMLHIPAVDKMMTDWIGSPLTQRQVNHRIMIAGFQEPLPEDEAPFFYEDAGKLWLLQGGFGGGPMDVTPPNVNIEYYASKHDITQELRNRQQCAVRDDGQQILFLLQDHNIPTLFLTDLTAGTTELVATNVDSFLFVGDRVVYACGYEQANQLYVYGPNEPELLATNVQSLALPLWDIVVSLDEDGVLYFHQIMEGTTKKVASNVLAIYSESGEGEHLSEATVFCRKKDGDYRVSLSKETRLQAGYLKEIYTSVGVSKDGLRQYVYCEARGALACIENGEQTLLFEHFGKIQKVFSWDERYEEFVVATQTGIYLLRANVEPGEGVAETLRLVSFKGDFKVYRNNPGMIQRFLEVYREGADRFYIQSVSGKSFILNESRPESWLNFMSSYLYGLSYVELKSDGNSAMPAVDCAVPLSRKLVAPLIREDVVVYKSVYDNGAIRSITTLVQGKVLTSDLLQTRHESKGQVDIVAEKIGGEIYFTLTPWGESPEYSILNEEGKSVSGIGKRMVSSMGFAYEWQN